MCKGTKKTEMLQKNFSKLIINTIQVDDGSMPDNWLTSKTLCLLTDCNKEKKQEILFLMFVAPTELL